jgi:dihydroflavonol-4-reductase
VAGLSLITGANGHLGNNLVRALLERGERVRASVRDPSNGKPFEGLGCELVRADMLDKLSMREAMEGVDTLYHCAAVFKHWAADPQAEIIEPNLAGTRNALEAAAEAGVRRVVYVSSMAALDRSRTPMNEISWGSSFPNPYYRAKTESERLAWRLAGELGVDMVAVLPSGMIGPNCFGRLTTSMNFLEMIVEGRLPIDPGFSFNFVDVRDVAEGMILAARKGRGGERYILATEPTIASSEAIGIVRSVVPGGKAPPAPPKAILLLLAAIMEIRSGVSGKSPALQVGNVLHFYKADERIDISKARRELGFDPRSPEQAIREAALYLAGRL